MDGFTRRKERVKESIMNAALELFHAYGFKKVSINEIAAKANVSPVSIYNHFGSKQDLIKDVLIKVIDGIYDARRAIIVDANTSFTEKLHQMLTAKDSDAYYFQCEHFQNYIYSFQLINTYIEILFMF